MVQSDCRTWRPRYGLARLVTALMIVAGMAAVLLTLAVYAYAEEKTVINEPLDWSGLLTMMIPAIWATIGPVVMKGVTATVNGVAGQYVPRTVQVILSSILGALAAGLAGDPSVAVATAVTGGASQVYASTEPHKLYADPPPQGKP